MHSLRRDRSPRLCSDHTAVVALVLITRGFRASYRWLPELHGGVWWQVLALDGHITRGEVPFRVQRP